MGGWGRVGRHERVERTVGAGGGGVKSESRQRRQGQQYVREERAIIIRVHV